MRAGLTEEEKAEGERARQALEDEAGGNEDDGEEGNYKNKSQFFTHLKKSEVPLHASLCTCKAVFMLNI